MLQVQGDAGTSVTTVPRPTTLRLLPEQGLRQAGGKEQGRGRSKSFEDLLGSQRSHFIICLTMNKSLDLPEPHCRRL